MRPGAHPIQCMFGLFAFYMYCITCCAIRVSVDGLVLYTIVVWGFPLLLPIRV